MCDTFAVTTPTGTLFAKNSDRPDAEPQLINYEGPRPASNRLATQYLKLGEDPGSVGTLMTQPDWLWGAETALSTQRSQPKVTPASMETRAPHRGGIVASR